MDYMTGVSIQNIEYVRSRPPELHLPIFKLPMYREASQIPFFDADLVNLKRAYNVSFDFPENNTSLEETPFICDQKVDDEERKTNLIKDSDPLEICQIEQKELGILTNESKDYKHSSYCISETKQELLNHNGCRTELSVKLNQCDQCHADFETESLLMEHNQIHSVIKCTKNNEVCKKNNGTAHQRILSQELPSKHSVCEKEFPALEYYARHFDMQEKETEVNKKSIERSFKCSTCHKQFSRKESLVKHSRIHTKDTLKCSLCDFVCKKKITLKMHVISHEGNRKHKCDQCNFSFTQIGHLKRHIARFNHYK